MCCKKHEGHRPKKNSKKSPQNSFKSLSGPQRTKGKGEPGREAWDNKRTCEKEKPAYFRPRVQQPAAQQNRSTADTSRPCGSATSGQSYVCAPAWALASAGCVGLRFCSWLRRHNAAHPRHSPAAARSARAPPLLSVVAVAGRACK